MANLQISNFFRGRTLLPFYDSVVARRPSGAPNFYEKSPLDNTVYWCNINETKNSPPAFPQTGFNFLTPTTAALDIDSNTLIGDIKCTVSIIGSLNYATDVNTFDFEYQFLLSSTDSSNDQTLGGVSMNIYLNVWGVKTFGKVVFDEQMTLPADGAILLKIRFTCTGVTASASPVNP